MIAIVTKYMGYTTHKPSRVKTSGIGCKSVTVSWDSEWNTEQNHKLALKAFILKNKLHEKHRQTVEEFSKRYIMGELPNGDYVWVRED